MTQPRFNGPLFIVGMPRSGTKLLRTLLNEHSRISIPEVETHFLPLWKTEWQSYGDLFAPAAFGAFYQRAIRLPYFLYLSEEQDIISEDDWYGRCIDFGIADVFRALMQHDAGIGAGEEIIWGDKTPSYLTHLPLLEELYPSARYIHIVRDVRDYCLSSNQAWGKHMLRAAQSWSIRIGQLREHAAPIGDRLLQIRYEDLLADPRLTLSAVCDHLDIGFEESMLTPSKSAENLGDTRGHFEIVTGNINKYIERIPTATLRKIESITSSELKAYGYPSAYTGPLLRVSVAELLLYRLLDGINLFRFEIRQRGLMKGVILRWRLFFTARR